MLLIEQPKIWSYSIHTINRTILHTHIMDLLYVGFFKKFPFAMEEKQFQAESKDNQ